MRRGAALLFLLACSTDDAALPVDEGSVDPFTVPEGACAPRTARFLGARTCSPVGFTDECPPGFARDASGWGCDPVLPPGPCAGATRAKLGVAECAPISDCGAPFPPPEATLFVDAAGPEDATHFRTIAAAVTAAPAGATIAIAAGTYTEAVDPSRDVTLVGRCAASVVVESPGGTAPGIDVNASNLHVVARGMTLSGHRGGVVVSRGTLTLEGVRLEANRDLGVVVVGASAKATLRDSVVRGTLPMANGNLGRGVDVEVGGTVELERASVEDNAEIGVFSEGGIATLTDSVVRGTKPQGNGETGRGLNVRRGGKITVTRSAIVANTDVGAFVTATGSTLTMEDSAVTDTVPRADGLFGRGIDVSAGADVVVRRSWIARNVDSGINVVGSKLTIEDTAIAGTKSTPAGEYGFALAVRDGSTANATRVALVDNAAFSLTIMGSEVTFDRSAIGSSRADGNGKYGSAINVLSGGRLRVTGGAIEDARFVGIFAAFPDTNVTIERTLVSGVAVEPASNGFGHGVVAIEGARVDLAGCVLEKSASAGLFYDASAGLVSQTIVRNNAIGVHAQSGTELVSPFPQGAQPNGLELLVSDDTRFENNASRVGSGQLPLPDVSGLR